MFWLKGWGIWKILLQVRHRKPVRRTGLLWLLCVPWCHAREFDAHTRITFSDMQQLLLALVL
jgi:hypothetical protein